MQTTEAQLNVDQQIAREDVHFEESTSSQKLSNEDVTSSEPFNDNEAVTPSKEHNYNEDIRQVKSMSVIMHQLKHQTMMMKYMVSLKEILCNTTLCMLAIIKFNNHAYSFIIHLYKNCKSHADSCIVMTLHDQQWNFS